MSDGALSQDEIDALMSGSSTGGFDFGDTPAAPVAEGDLSESEKQQFLTLINSITETQAATLTGMMGKTVTIQGASVDIVDGSSVASSIPGNFIRINASFTEGISGYHSYLIPEDLSKLIAALLTGLEQIDLDDAAMSAISEAINTISGSAVTAFGDKKNITIMTEPPAADLKNAADSDIQPGALLKISYPVAVEGENPSVFYELFDISAVKEIIGGNTPAPMQGGGDVDDLLSGLGMGSQPAQNGGMAGAAVNMGGGKDFNQSQGGGMMSSPSQSINVQNVQYPPLSGVNMDSEQGNISLLMDVNMEMTVELGRTKKPIREILSMGEGTIIELDKLAGEPVDILVNHKLIANGEVVVIDENFGVRVTKIVSPNAGLTDLS
jgi:flagellar motor switch protein FliN/FliY